MSLKLGGTRAHNRPKGQQEPKVDQRPHLMEILDFPLRSSPFKSVIALGFLSVAFSFGPAPLQDLCVADPTSPATPSGPNCKNPTLVTANDFFFSGLNLPSNTSNILGAGFTPVGINQVPGLNTLGISVARVDLTPNGAFPPHIHPRATEIVTVLEGSLQVGFVTSNPANQHFTKTLQKGDVFVTPIGLVHYAYNVGKGNTAALVAWNSHDFGGVTLLPKAIFGANPDISSDYLARTFFLDKKIVEELQAKF
ncbi:hypothetical protein RD792_000346 [Penstemon davidsonii]|uniref:Germin-like protein n=1 Tax=Penstemon davidsonii TaxID=160366 RepID=A0ABR0DKL2_9LAMI|nr:hypothetical protein RD792_000346 [Penstemon davidsonii]